MKQYLTDYLNLAWDTDVQRGLRAWLSAFQDALDSRDDEACRGLLQNLKSTPRRADMEELARYAEGQWREQRGEYRQVRDLYRQALALVRAAGTREREARSTKKGFLHILL